MAELKYLGSIPIGATKEEMDNSMKNIINEIASACLNEKAESKPELIKNVNTDGVNQPKPAAIFDSHTIIVGNDAIKFDTTVSDNFFEINSEIYSNVFHNPETNNLIMGNRVGMIDTIHDSIISANFMVIWKPYATLINNIFSVINTSIVKDAEMLKNVNSKDKSINSDEAFSYTNRTVLHYPNVFGYDHFRIFEYIKQLILNVSNIKNGEYNPTKLYNVIYYNLISYLNAFAVNEYESMRRDIVKFASTTFKSISSDDISLILLKLDQSICTGMAAASYETGVAASNFANMVYSMNIDVQTAYNSNNYNRELIANREDDVNNRMRLPSVDRPILNRPDDYDY